MPDLSDLINVELEGQMYGAYKEPWYRVPGIDEPVRLYDLLVYILDNLGGIGSDDITEGEGDPSGDPGAGPQVYLNTLNGELWTWNGTTWVLNGPLGALPIYDSIESAQAAGLTSGQRFKLSEGNLAGQLAGTVIELL